MGERCDTVFALRDYDFIFDWYVTERSPLIGLPEIQKLAASLAPRARILDLGCGTGIPIAQFLIKAGFELFAIDSSERMIASFREQFPGVPAACERIQDSTCFNTTFDAVISWGVMFHLDRSAQERVISNVAQALNPVGKFLFTSGDKEGTVEGVMDGVMFQYVSLGIDAYSAALERNGLVLIDHYCDAAENYVYLASKEREAS